MAVILKLAYAKQAKILLTDSKIKPSVANLATLSLDLATFQTLLVTF